MPSERLIGKRIGPKISSAGRPFEQRADDHEQGDGQREETGAAGADASHPFTERLRHPLAHQDPRERRGRGQHPQRCRRHGSALRQLRGQLVAPDAAHHQPGDERVDDREQRRFGHRGRAAEDPAEQKDGQSERDRRTPRGAREIAASTRPVTGQR